MWEPRLEFSETKHLCKVTINQNNQPMTFSEVLESWKSNAEFREFYILLLSDMPYAAVFWEIPPITKATISKPYEFVAADSPSLVGVPPNSTAFEQYFKTATNHETVVSFANLGNDAWLIAPCPIDSHNIYTHLVKFLREAPNEQCHEFFCKLGMEIENKLSDEPLWISTSGLGIYWLHARLDSYPKYYTYSPYKTFK